MEEFIKDPLVANPRILEKAVRLLGLALLQIELDMLFYIPCIKIMLKKALIS
jgi:hypothetical protein